METPKSVSTLLPPISCSGMKEISARDNARGKDLVCDGGKLVRAVDDSVPKHSHNITERIIEPHRVSRIFFRRCFSSRLSASDPVVYSVHVVGR